MYEEAIREAALEAGKIVSKAFHKEVSVDTKENFKELVTKTDIEAEKRIKEVLGKNHPEIGFIGEETEDNIKEINWIVDPIDGTTNFTNKIPFFCVNIALKKEKEIIAGCIYNPISQELFYAEKGKGTSLNGEGISVSSTASLKESLFSIAIKDAKEKEYIAFGKFNDKTRGMLRTGSAGLNLAYIAAGRMTGMWSMNSPVWDVAAGIILVEEAGGNITDFSGNPYSEKSLLATNGKVHDEALQLLGSLNLGGQSEN